MSVKKLSLDTALNQIAECLEMAGPGEAPFVLVLGSGFSHGLVPTARELVNESLPLWRKWKKSGEKIKFEEFFKRTTPPERNQSARDFWHQFIERNKLSAQLSLDSSTGLPVNSADAYKLAFDHNHSTAAGDPMTAREFQRDLMRLDQPRLNAAHFLLGSLLGVQPGKRRPSMYFKSQAAFCRLILTTNFDPFLQIALQMVNRLYFMSDTPELGVNDEIFDDDVDAIHLVYLHGSIHRRAQHATEESIRELKAKNARTLSPVLKKRGIIVLGYSGWDDTLVEALSGCDTFGHRLYWCGLREDPFGGNSYGPRVIEILNKSSAFYVHTPGGAGMFMAQLFNRIVNGNPRLLDNPIAQFREMLEAIDLRELDSAQKEISSAEKIPSAETSDTQQTLIDSAGKDAFCNALARTLRGLKCIESDFISICSGEKTLAPKPKEEKTPTRRTSEALMAKLYVTAAMGNHLEALKLISEALELPGLASKEHAEFLEKAFVAEYHLGKLDACLISLSRMIDLPGASVEQIARALYNRGIVFAQKGEKEKAIADFTVLIEQLPGASVELIAKALINRGFALGEKGDTEEASADYSRVIKQLPGASVELIAKALYNRGLIFEKKSETDKAIADYTRVIEQLPGASVELIGMALRSRGAIFGRKGGTENAISDYTRVIEQLPGAPPEQIASALAGRGWNYYLRKEIPAFLRDTKAAVDRMESLDFAGFNLGLAFVANQQDESAETAYRAAATRWPDKIEVMGLVDLREAAGSWLDKVRADKFIGLLESLKPKS